MALYAELEELKSYLRIDSGDDADDSELTDALTSASRGIDDVCQRQFSDAVTPSARTYRPVDGSLVKVDDFHTTVGLVVKTDSSGGGVYGTTWPAADFQLEPLNGVVAGSAGWPYWKVRAVGSGRFPCARRASVEVTARWGWAEVPAQVKQACLIVAAETFKLRDAPFGVAGFGDFGAVRIRDNQMAMTKLQPYIRDAVLLA